MYAKKLLVAQLVILAVLLFVVLYGIAHDYLWSIFWFSGLAHFLGGIWAGIFGIWVFRSSDASPRLFYCIGVALALGICWELFEVVIGATHFPADTIDTVQDIMMDIVGGAIAGLTVRYRA